MVFGLVVRSRGLGGNLMAGLRSLGGGEIHEYTSLLEDTRRQALDRLVANATLLGANAVLSMRFDSSELSGTMSEIVAYGTAVIVAPGRRRRPDAPSRMSRHEQRTSAQPARRPRRSGSAARRRARAHRARRRRRRDHRALGRRRSASSLIVGALLERIRYRSEATDRSRRPGRARRRRTARHAPWSRGSGAPTRSSSTRRRPPDARLARSGQRANGGTAPRTDRWPACYPRRPGMRASARPGSTVREAPSPDGRRRPWRTRPTDGRRHASAARRAPKPTFPYLNRELSWLEFNARVLHEARDERNPLLERVKFLAIFAGNLDEFFQVRVAGLRQQVEAGKVARSPDGRTADEQLAAARARVLELVADHSPIFVDVRRALAAEGIELLDYAAIPEHHEALRQRFLDEIFPVLTPLAVDPGHPFPYISTLSLSIAVGLRDPETGERGFARVKVPQILPRLLEVEPSRFVLIDQVIEANLDTLFSGHGGRGAPPLPGHPQRRPRDRGGRGRRPAAGHRGGAPAPAVRRGGPARGRAVDAGRDARAPAARPRASAEDDCYEVSGMLDLTGLWSIADLDRPDLKPVPWTPVTPPRLIPPDEDEPADVFAAIRAGDILVHHPYESFAASVERFITQAADDPDVLTIKQTLYRTSGDSPIVQSLIRAAERGKQVVVLVEIKARFDEEANIVWARKLERAGRPRRLRPGRAQDALEDGARRPARGLRPAPLRPHRDRQLQPEDRPAVRRPRPADLPARRSAPTSPTCSTS